MNKGGGLASLFLVVHGETGWEAEGRIQGWLDMPLNREGLKQAERLASDLKGENIKTIIIKEIHSK